MSAGVYIPAEVILSPLHVPDAGLPIKLTAIGWLHSALFPPAVTIGSWFTFTVVVEVLEQPVLLFLPDTI